MPDEEYRQLQPHLELVSARSGEVLCEAGGRAEYVYFPLTSLISLLYVMADGASTEVAVVGREGMVGVAMIMGGESTPNEVLVLGDGDSFRLKGEVIKRFFHQLHGLQQSLLRYSQALMTQIAQNAVCNRRHSLEQQLCRWLLLNLDRMPGNELKMTQGFIANMLGVRREGVTEAAGRLQQAGIIRYRRGHITVLARHKLEARACECYEVVRREFERLLHGRL